MLKQIVLSYLRYFARLALKWHHPTIIGIAGSVGKSSTRNAIEAILKDHFKVKAVGNSETGIPLGILGMTPKDYSKKDWILMLIKAPLGINFLRGTKYLIAEMGIDDPYPPKNMEYLLTILKPHIALVLNESATHTQQFGKLLTVKQKEEMTEKERTDFLIEKITDEDTKIITESGCRIGIYNADNYFVTKKLTEDTKKIPGTLLAFGETGITDISFGDYNVSPDGTRFEFSFKHVDHKKVIRLNFPNHILPKVYREVFAAAILTSLQTGLDLEKIIGSLEKNLQLPKGRSSLFKGLHNSLIIDSSYNASKSSTLAFLSLVKRLKNKDHPVVFVFGDMRELGNVARVEHEEVAERTKGIIDYLYLVGPLTREYVLPVVQEHEEKYKEIRWFDSSIRAGEFLKDNLPKNAVVLFKGSQNTIFLEEAIKEILLDKKDIKNLCRQSTFWKKVKNK